MSQKKTFKIEPPVKKEQEIEYEEDNVLGKLISSIQAQHVEILYYSPYIWTTSRLFLLLTVASEPQHLYNCLSLNSSP
jgi:hypothetical protein